MATSTPIKEATCALAQVERALTAGGLACQRVLVEHDLNQFRRVLASWQANSASDNAEIGFALRGITSYALFVEVLSAKSPVMQVILHDELRVYSNKAHAAVIATGLQSTAMSQSNGIVEAADAVDISDPAVQLEALAFLTARPSVDPIALALVDKLDAVSSTDVKSQAAKLPVWFVTEHDIEVIRSLNSSGGSTTIDAVHNPTSHRVALQHIADIEREDFASSMTLWRGLHNEHVASLVGANHLAVPRPFVATEYFVLGSLDNFLRANESTRALDAISLLFEAASGLSAIHLAGVVHRDLRCANIFVTQERHAKIGGLVHCFDYNSRRFRSLSTDKLERATTSVNKKCVRWLAPECMVVGEVSSPASDVYAFGLTIYEALTGAVPFADLSDDEVVEVKKTSKDAGLSESCLARLDYEASSMIRDACNASPTMRPSMQIILMSLRSMHRSAGASTSSSVRQSSEMFAHRVSNQPHNTEEHSNASASTTKTVGYTPQVYSVLQSTPQSVAGQPAVQNYVSYHGHGTDKVVPATEVYNGAAAVRAPTQKTMAPSPSGKAPTPRWKKVCRLAGVIIVIAGVVVALVLTVGKPENKQTTTRFTVSTVASNFTTNPLTGIAISTYGDVYVSDKIRIFEIHGMLGNASVPLAGTSVGYGDGVLLKAQFNNISGITVNQYGSLLVADTGNNRIRQVDQLSGYVLTVVGTGSSSLRDGGVATASVGYPKAFAVANTSSVYFIDAYSRGVRLLDTLRRTVSTIRTTTATASAIVVGPFGTLYLATKHSIMTLTTDGKTSTIAGQSTAGFRNGVGTNAMFNTISSLAFSVAGDLMYIADRNNHCIRQLNMSTRAVTTLAARCTVRGSSDNTLVNATMEEPAAIAVASNGTVYVVEGGSLNARVRKIIL